MIASFQKLHLVLAITLLAFTKVTEAETAGEPLPDGYREVSEDVVSSLRELCEATAATGLFSGAVLVAKDGEVIYSEGFGLANREWDIPNTIDTKFRLASVSKQFCTMLV